MLKIIISLFLICFILNVSILHARYKMGEKKPRKVHRDDIFQSGSTKSPSHRSQKPVNETPVLEDLSDRYQVDIEILEYIRTLKHGYEELVPALIVAREAQIEVGHVLKQRNLKRTWREIAEQYSIELKPLNREVLAVLNPIKRSLPEKLITERPKFIKNDNQ